jgi:hypothetical protein
MVVAMVEDDEERRRLALPKADSDGRQPELIGDILDRVLAGLRPARLGMRKAGGGRSDESKGSPPAKLAHARSGRPASSRSMERCRAS